VFGYIRPFEHLLQTSDQRSADSLCNKNIRIVAHDSFLNLYYSTSRRNYSQKVIDKYRNQPVWLEDISTYPIILICGGACIGAGTYIAYKFMSSPDVRYDKNKRGSEIRWWGDDKAQQRIQK
jgi:hypothetical protein